jgi:hypothetical protein
MQSRFPSQRGHLVDVIEVNLIGPLAVGVGRMSYLFGAFVASLPAMLKSDHIRADPKEGRRPHFSGSLRTATQNADSV